MADVLKHLETVRGDRAVDWWTPRSFLYSQQDKPDFSTDYLDRYRLKLVSQVGYAINPADERGAAMANQTARRALVNHLYREQLDIAHDLLHALYAGEDRNKIIERVSHLIETMTER